MNRRKDNRNRVLKEGEYQRANGSYEYKWKDRLKKRHSVYAPTLEKLREKEEELLKDKFDGLRTDGKNLTLNDVYYAWFKLKKGIKEKTLVNYKYLYETFVEDDLGKLKIRNLKRSDIKCFYNSLVDKKDISISTVENIQKVVHQVLEMAVEDEYIRSNPSDNSMKELKKSHGYEPTRRKALTVEQQQRLEDFLAHTPRYAYIQPIITVMLWTGMRVGEVTALQWCDIDFENDTINVNHTVSYYNSIDNSGYKYHISDPKTKTSKRTIPMLPIVKQAFLQEKQFQEELEIKCNVEIDGYTDFIFLTSEGNIQNKSSINSAINRIIRDCNKKAKEDDVMLPHFSCHTLRHTFTTRMCENDVNIKAIQTILGHSKISVTMDIYAEATEDFKRAELIDFEKNFTSQKEQTKAV